MTKEQKQDLLKEVRQGIDSVTSSEEWKRWLDENAKFWTYSFFNQCLIRSQLATASRVAGFRTWNKLGRRVLRGASGLTILAPRLFKEKPKEEGSEARTVLAGFIPVTVFDVSQTEGPELANPARSHGEAPEVLAKLEAFAKAEGFTVDQQDLGPDMGGYLKPGRAITLNGSWSTEARARTLIHELAHAFHGHLEEKKKPRLLQELEAETTTWTVCRVLGLGGDETSFAYLASWSREGREVGALEVAAKAAQRVSKRLLEALEGPRTASESPA